MKVRRTPYPKRSTYTYHYTGMTEQGQYCNMKETIRAGQDGVTEEHIRIIYQEEDREVYNNLKHFRWFGSASEMGYQWNIPIDAYDDVDNSDIGYMLTYEPMDEESEKIERLHQIVNSLLTEKQRTIYQKKNYAGCSETEIAKELRCSVANVCKALKRIEEIIKKNF